MRVLDELVLPGTWDSLGTNTACCPPADVDVTVLKMDVAGVLPLYNGEGDQAECLSEHVWA